MLPLNPVLLNQLCIKKGSMKTSLKDNGLDNESIVPEILRDMSLCLEFIHIPGIFPSQWHSKAA